MFRRCCTPTPGGRPGQEYASNPTPPHLHLTNCPNILTPTTLALPIHKSPFTARSVPQPNSLDLNRRRFPVVRVYTFTRSTPASVVIRRCRPAFAYFVLNTRLPPHVCVRTDLNVMSPPPLFRSVLVGFGHHPVHGGTLNRRSVRDRGPPVRRCCVNPSAKRALDASSALCSADPCPRGPARLGRRARRCRPAHIKLSSSRLASTPVDHSAGALDVRETLAQRARHNLASLSSRIAS